MVKRFLRAVLLLFVFVCFCSRVTAGFSAETLIKTPYGYTPIENIAVGDAVICCNACGESVERTVTATKHQKKSAFCQITLSSGATLVCSGDQRLYLSTEFRWCRAAHLMVGQSLVCANRSSIIIESVEFCDKQVCFYDIEVDHIHNFFVSRDDVLAHNFVFTVPLVAWGAGAVSFLSGVTLKTVVTALGAAVVCYGVKKVSGRDLDVAIGLDGTVDDIASILVAADKEGNAEKKSGGRSKEELTGAQAPGQPRAEDGYIPPKNWDGKKRKVEKGKLRGSSGWPDKKGNVWVPTGENSLEKPHWDVQNPNSGSHTNVYPGGKIRGKDARK